MSKTLLLPVKEAANRLGVSIITLYRWEKAKKISVIRTVGGQRRISIEEIDRLLGKPTTNAVEEIDTSLENPSTNSKKCCIYIKLRSQKDINSGKLESKKYQLSQKALELGYEVANVIVEKGSSLKKVRPEFDQLMDLAINKSFQVLIVEEKNWLLPFHFNYFEKLLNGLDIALIVLNDSDNEYQKEISKDLISYLFISSKLLTFSPSVLLNFKKSCRKLLKALLNHP
jgi:excisionase family DNA binding protein